MSVTGRARVLIALLGVLTAACDVDSIEADDGDTIAGGRDNRIFFERRTFVPEPDVATFLAGDDRHGLLQFSEPPASLASIRAMGIQIHGAQRHGSYYVSIPDSLSSKVLRRLGARALFSMQPLDRISSRLVPLGADQPERGTTDLHVVMHFVPTTDRRELRDALRSVGATVVGMDQHRGRATLALPSSALLELANHDWIWWLDAAQNPLTTDLDVARARIGADEVQPPPWGAAPGATGLTGDGVVVGLWEVAALGAAGVLDAHPDLVGRVSIGPGQNDQPSSHATQVAGVIAGDGTASEAEGGSPLQWAGIAPEAQLVSWDSTDSAAEMVTSLALFDTTITNHSFGIVITAEPECSVAGFYDTLGADYDDVVRGSDITAFVSPGNNGEQIGTVGCTIDVWDGGVFASLAPEVVDAGFGSVSVLGVAKNPVAVGGRRKSEPVGIADYSGRGPTRDGRLKPDVVAISGDDESLLTMPSTPPTYESDLGVSFAVPQAAGGAALLLEHYRQGDPTFIQDPAVFKAVLANTAADVGAPGPDYANGYGLIQLPRVLSAAGSYLTMQVSQGEEEMTSLGVDVTDACGLRIMAAWNDPPSMGPSAMQIVNDVDLTVLSGDEEILPWVLTPTNPLNLASRGVNSVDNLEQVTVDNPTGNEIIRISGTDVPFGPQEVVVHWYAVPCDEEEGTGSGGQGGDDGSGCSCVSGVAGDSDLLDSLLLLLLVMRRRSDGHPGTG